MTRHPGFTLLEMLVVITVIGLAVLAAPRLGGSWAQRMDHRAAVQKIVQAMTRARVMAVATRNPVEIVFDLQTRTWRTIPRGPSGAIPGGEIRLLGVPGEGRDASSGRNGNNVSIRFFADGGSSGGTLLLGMPDNLPGETRIATDWLSGRIEASEQ